MAHKKLFSGTEGGLHFFPNFFALRPFFILAIAAELLAIVLILATGNKLSESWDELGLLSLFILWIVLLSAGILTFLRNHLSQLPLQLSVMLAYFLVIMVTVLMAIGGQYFMLEFDYVWGCSRSTTGEFVVRCTIISSIMTLVAFRYFYMQQQWKKRIELESEARVEALQARIRPHFLFNSMNIISSLISTKPTLAEQAVEDLSELFRATLKDKGSLVSLSDEWVLCRHYLHIETLRLGDRLKLDWDFSNVPNDAAIPMLSLQPLVENAIYHGIQPIPDGGLISVKGELIGTDVEIKIANPMPQHSGYPKHKGHKIGLTNIKHRLNLLFGTNAGLIVNPGATQYEVILRFPYLRVGEVSQT